MRDIFAIWVVIVLVFLFFFSLFSLAESGYSNLIITVLTGFGLYRILRCMYKGRRTGTARGRHPTGSGGADESPGPLEFIIFGEMTEDIDAERWDDYS